MSRELWAEERCEHGNVGICVEITNTEHLPFSGVIETRGCLGGERKRIDFDAIWRRYLDKTVDKATRRLTYDELKQVVLGGTE